MLDRLQGSGNYIRHGADGASVYGMFRLELPEGGGLPRADVLDVQALDKPDDLPDFLRVREVVALHKTLFPAWFDRPVLIDRHEGG